MSVPVVDLVRGAASFEYTTGPDGKRYAVGGEVSIDTTEGRTPEETVVQGAENLCNAAMAPADPFAAGSCRSVDGGGHEGGGDPGDSRCSRRIRGRWHIEYSRSAEPPSR
jgi:hypothetical protein